MIRLFLYTAFVLVLAFGGAWMADHPGEVSIQFEDWQLDSSFAFLGLLVAALMAVSALLIWVVGYASRELPFLGSNRVIKRQSRGLTLLNRSMIALSTGDPQLARRLIEEAEVLLPPQPMVTMIAAEAASRLGDKGEASKRFESLRASEDGKILGLRGLAQQAEAAGKSKEALVLAREALSDSVKNPWALKTIFALEVKAAEWDNALETIKKIEKQKLMDADEIKHHRSAIHYARGTETKMTSDLDKARKDYAAAVKERASFTEAHLALARIDHGRGKSAQAIKQINSAWKTRPHRALSDQLLAFNPTATPSAALLSVRDLVGENPDHTLSKIVLSEALDRDGQSEAADKVMQDVRTSMGLNFHDVIPDDSSFQCIECGTRQEHWSLNCGQCHSFNSLRWFDAFDAGMTTLKPTKTTKIIDDDAVVLMVK